MKFWGMTRMVFNPSDGAGLCDTHRPRREPRVLGTDAAACALVAAGAARVERTARLMACTRVPLWALEHLHWRRDGWDRWWVVAGLRGLLQVGTA